MPDNGSSTVAKFALAVPGVVVAEKEVVLSHNIVPGSMVIITNQQDSIGGATHQCLSEKLGICPNNGAGLT